MAIQHCIIIQKMKHSMPALEQTRYTDVMEMTPYMEKAKMIRCMEK